jgi:hypothetical protein
MALHFKNKRLSTTFKGSRLSKILPKQLIKRAYTHPAKVVNKKFCSKKNLI